MNATRRLLLLVLFASLPVAAAAAPRSVDAGSHVETFSDPSSAGTLQTSLRWGELRVAAHDAPEVRVDARVEVESRLASELSESGILDAIEIRLVERDNVVELRVDSTLSGFYGVDLTVWVPGDTSLALEMRDGGNIRVDGVRGDIDIANRNGSVTLAGLGGAAVVHARNGTITAAFDALPADRPMSFSTLNGSVDVTFPDTLSAEVRVRYSRGGVESDFPIVTQDGAPAEAATAGLERRATRLLEGRIGDGGPRYYFHTANGTVYLRRN